MGWQAASKGGVGVGEVMRARAQAQLMRVTRLSRALQKAETRHSVSYAQSGT
jgi:hypothetical protein